jgi:hypothetical protein
MDAADRGGGGDGEGGRREGEFESLTREATYGVWSRPLEGEEKAGKRKEAGGAWSGVQEGEATAEGGAQAGGGDSVGLTRELEVGAEDSPI